MNRSRSYTNGNLDWALKQPMRIICIVLAAFLILDWAVLDRWHIKGQVLDQRTGKGIEGAWILANFNGEAPLLNLPIPPHPNHRTGECMGTRVTTTDGRGQFHFDELTTNKALANKSAYIVAFKPGWLVGAKSSDIASSLLTVSSEVKLTLNDGPGERRSATLYSPESIAMRLDPAERTRSDELFETSRVMAQINSMCDLADDRVWLAAMNHVLSIASTYDERNRVRRACRSAADEWRSNDFGTNRHFDCDNLPFKMKPSPEALAVEAELAAKRKAFR